MKRKDNNSGFFLFWRGAIMQLKITTDYAIRIVLVLCQDLVQVKMGFSSS